MTLKYHISPSALTEDFIVRIWEAASDGVGAEVYEQTIAAPHAAPVTITVNGLDKVVHIVRMYSAISAVLLHEYNVEPTTDIVTVFDPIFFKIGDGGTNTPAADTDICTTPELAGLSELTDFVIFRANYGPLQPTVHFTFNSGTGEWQLNSPDVFGGEGGGEEFTIVRAPQSVSTVVNDSVVGKWFAGFVNISANTNYANTHLRKLIRFSGSPTYTFQVSDTIPIGYVFCFQHFGASSGTATINFNNGTLLFNGSPVATKTLPRGTQAAFVFDGTNWNTVYYVPPVASTTPVAGDILGVGTYNVGNVATGDPTYIITHSLAISGDYGVLISIESNTIADYTRNNRIGSCWFHHATDKPNKFYVGLQELAVETQNLSIFWTIIKR